MFWHSRNHARSSWNETHMDTTYSQRVYGCARYLRMSDCTLHVDCRLVPHIVSAWVCAGGKRYFCLQFASSVWHAVCSRLKSHCESSIWRSNRWNSSWSTCLYYLLVFSSDVWILNCDSCILIDWIVMSCSLVRDHIHSFVKLAQMIRQFGFV